MQEVQIVCKANYKHNAIKKKLNIAKFNVEMVINIFHFTIIGCQLVYSTFNIAIKIPKLRGGQYNQKTKCSYK